jgi:tetratricopeptide (TPR) repeat protein
MDSRISRCLRCGAKFEVTGSSDTVTCTNCGDKIAIKASINTINSNLENLFDLANSEYSLGNYEKAIDYFNKILEIDSKNYNVHILKGISQSQQYSINDFKFKELFLAYSNAINHIVNEEWETFIQYILDVFDNHGTKCENLLSESYKYGVDYKDLQSVIEKYYCIIDFYEKSFLITEIDLRFPKKIVEITRSLKRGIKGKGNRYNEKCELITDWKYELSDELIQELDNLENKYISIIRQYEPEFYMDTERKNEDIAIISPKKSLFDRISQIFS